MREMIEEYGIAMIMMILGTAVLAMLYQLLSLL